MRLTRPRPFTLEWGVESNLIGYKTGGATDLRARAGGDWVAGCAWAGMAGRMWAQAALGAALRGVTGRSVAGRRLGSGGDGTGDAAARCGMAPRGALP